MKDISTGIYTFEKLITEGKLYVDKTKYIYNIAKESSGYYFLSRPRRFGKSLTVSTLDALFHGKKELFKGLYIYDADYDWKEYPVIHIDFGKVVMKSIAELNKNLLVMLGRTAEYYGVDFSEEDAASGFERLINSLGTKYNTQVVLLIDEYDKPILDHMNSPEEVEEYRNYMDSFYQVIKGSESMLRFVFITGVTKFAKVSIFSKLNNIEDITMNRDFASMLGYTQSEFETNFSEYIDNAVTESGVTHDELLAKIKFWYDGFLFHEHGEKMYNPVSIGKFMNNNYEFRNYWFATGTPTFLIKMLKKNGLVLCDLKDVLMSANSFDTFDVTTLASDTVENTALMQMLYQTGYLTLDKVMIEEPKTYRLRFPNYEVEQSFSESLVNAYTGPAKTGGFISGFVTSAYNGDTDEMMEYMQTFFSELPYDIQIKSEKYYQSIVYTIFKMCGMKVMTELRTNIGRIDAVMTIGDQVYIIEFKLNRSADVALEQIDEKKYADGFILPARRDGKTIHKLGINFCCSEEVRNVTDWREEVV